MFGECVRVEFRQCASIVLEDLHAVYLVDGNDLVGNFADALLGWLLYARPEHVHVDGENGTMGGRWGG